VEEDVNINWMTLRIREDDGNWKEEALDRAVWGTGFE
jgi:hypothetical protein